VLPVNKDVTENLADSDAIPNPKFWINGSNSSWNNGSSRSLKNGSNKFNVTANALQINANIATYVYLR